MGPPASFATRCDHGAPQRLHQRSRVERASHGADKRPACLICRTVEFTHPTRKKGWRRGAFETLEQLLDPSVEWRWFEPGEWDCHGRDEVLPTLRERYGQSFAEGALEFRDGGENMVIVVSHPSQIGGLDWPAETATVMQFREGRVVSMQDYPSERDALVAVGRG
ncbi:MAG: hypothetical protein H0W90_14965 [Actinobacteria bacterium]|nr:hypothetical protein [Actinomycetota bacterium]